MHWTWKSFDYLIVIGALLIGFAVWFMPNMEASPEIQALYKAANERTAEIKAIEAAEAAIEKEREDLGIVYLPPVVQPDAPAAPAQ